MPRRLAAILIWLSVAPAAFAQSRFECTAAADVPLTTTHGTFTTAYQPLLIFGNLTSSSAGQVLTLRGGRAPGLEVGATWWITPHVGVRVDGRRSWRVVSGANGPYAARIDYISIQPPSSTPAPFSFSRSFAWPDTEGRLIDSGISVSLVWRMRAGAVDVTLQGGLNAARLEGRFERIAFQEFRLGGHSTLFYNQADLRMHVSGAWHLGPGVGLDVAVPLSRRLAAFGGARLTGRRSSHRVYAGEAIEGDLVLFEQTLTSINRQIASRPLALDGAVNTSLVFGVRFRI